MACLFWQGPSGSGRHELAGETTLGRAEDCDIRLRSRWVSKLHAVLRAEGEDWIVEDAGSRNGIVVNGEAKQRSALADGDVIGIGPFRMSFYAGAPPRASVPAQEGADDLESVFVTIDGLEQDDREVAHVVTLSGTRPARSMAAPRTTNSPEILARRLKAGYAISQATAATLEQPVLLDRVLGALFDIFDTAERAFILLVDPGLREVKAGAVKRRDAGDKDTINVSRTALSQVLRNREALLCLDAMHDNLLGDAESVAALGIRSLMIAPLLSRDRLYGAIYIDTVSSSVRYSEDDLELLSAAAAQVAGALANLEMHRKVVEVERLAAVGQTVAGLTHCIKNILQGVKGGAYILEKGLGRQDCARVAKGWAMVKRKNDFMEELVWDLLTLSKPRTPEYAATDLNALCAEVCEIGRERNEGSAVTVSLVPDPSLEAVEVDPKGIRRCLLNLVTNAVDACAEAGGTVTVETRRSHSDDSVTVLVRDTGCGMPQETIDKLFGVFFSTKGSKGTGLGLPITRKIAEEHGGRIEVDSAEGAGTTFTIRLPVKHTPLETGDHDCGGTG